MAENLDDINILIQHRKERLGFARMISWEMSREASIRTRRISKKSHVQSERSKSNSSSVSDEEDSSDYLVSASDDSLSCDSSDSDSKYYTAEETVLEEDTDNFGDFFAKNKYDLSSVLCSQNVDENVRSADSLLSSNIHHETQVPVLNHQRRQSKKKRKQKKRKFQLIYADSLPQIINEDALNFVSTFDTVLDVGALVDDSKLVHISKSASSLMELSLKACWSSRYRFKECPFALKSTIQSYRYHQILASMQLNALYRHIAHMDKHNYHWFHNLKGSWGELLATRDVFHIMDRPSSNSFQPVLSSSKSSSFLQWTAFSILVSKTEIGREECHIIHSTLSALAHTIDLMLPSTFSHRPRKGCIDDEKLTLQSKESAVYRVRTALKARFPIIVDRMFDEALAYVFWARGNIPYAVDQFVKLAAQKDNYLEKATILSEVGRMYAQLDETLLAQKYYRIATDAAMETTRSSDDVAQINQQLLVLLSNVNDQGLMTPQKACESANFWDSTLRQRNPSRECTEAALNSFLCFHCGSRTDYASWLAGAESKMKVWMMRHSSLYLYHSLIMALQGNDKESKESYETYYIYNNEAQEGPKENIWQPVITGVVKQSLKPMQVVWRTQLESCSYDSETASSLADVCSQHINLRISPNGFLTADMQQLLPPIRGIFLDPYTGQRVIQSIPGMTEAWTSTCCCEQCIDEPGFSTDMMFLLTPREVYGDDTGNHVHLLMTSEYMFSRRYSKSFGCQMATLYWMDKDGNKAKVSLLDCMRKLSYEICKSLIQKNYRQQQKSYRIQWRKRILELLDRLYSRGQKMDYYIMEQSIKTFLVYEEKQMKENKKADKFVDPETTLYSLEIYQIVQYSRTLMIAASEDHADTHELFFFDCKDAQSFCCYKRIHQTVSFKYTRAAYPNLYNNTIPGKVIWYDHGTKNNVTGTQCLVFDEHGNELFTSCLETPETLLPGIRTPYILGDMLFGIHKSKKKLLVDYDCNGVIEEVGEFPEIQGINTVGECIMLHTIEGVSFLEVEHLKSRTIMVEKQCLSNLLTKEKMTIIEGNFKRCKILEMKRQEKHMKVAIGLDSAVIVASLVIEPSDCSPLVLITMCVSVPGVPKEVLMFESMGLVVSATMNDGAGKVHYRENVYHFEADGRLSGILPMVGPGPRSFCVKHLSSNEENPSKQLGNCNSRWHLFMNDGYGGILAVVLKQY